MKRRVLLSCVALALLASVCAFARGEKEGGPAAAARADEPRYGGTLTMTTSVSNIEPPSPDIWDSNYFSLRYLDFALDRPIRGDIRKGPKGANEYAFQVDTYIPEKYWVGEILQSWEVHPDKLIWKVRPGIRWAADHVKFMESRELTAEDVALDLIDFWKSPWGSRFEKTVKDIYHQGKDTVVIELKSFSHEVFIFFGYEDRSLISPPEVRKAGPKKWENQVGSGPFQFQEYVVGSHMSFKKNPNYWDKAIINGKEYKIPFIDRVVIPIIPDESTQIAALRTGKTDIQEQVNVRQWNTLEKTAPKLKSAHYAYSCSLIAMRDTIPPFNNVNLRRAMMIGTDLEATRKFGLATEFPLHAYPAIYTDPTVYVPMEKLPEDVRILYKYDPALAKKMIADAGYPNGFTTDIYVSSVPEQQDLASLIKGQWAKIGVTLNIKAFPPVEHSMFMNSRTYPSVGLHSNQIASPMQTISVCARTGGWGNRGDYSNPKVDELADLMVKELDIGKRTQMSKDVFAIMRSEVDNIPLYMQPMGHYWWPWVRNHHGELSSVDGAMSSLVRYWWIDQDMKKEMGF